MNVTKNIKDLWNEIILLTSGLKKSHKASLDGLTLWNQIKPQLLDVPRSEDIKWNPNHEVIKKSLADVTNALPEKDKKDNLIEHNHFFLQLLNIPKKDPSVPLNRLLQLALNIGQLSPYLDDKLFGFNIIQIFNDNNLDDINTYILDEDIEKYEINQELIDTLNTILEDLKSDPPLKNLVGGNVFCRYNIKYSKIF